MVAVIGESVNCAAPALSPDAHAARNASAAPAVSLPLGGRELIGELAADELVPGGSALPSAVQRLYALRPATDTMPVTTAPTTPVLNLRDTGT